MTRAFSETWSEALHDAVLAALPERHAHPELDRYYTLLRDYPLRGGKRLRGRLLLASAAAHGGDWRAALPVAAALELFQNWVLVHDDIEDDSEERRGAPALHRQVGLALALNAGDAMHAYMWGLLASLDLPRQRAILEEFAAMIHRTAEGQHLDLAWVAEARFDIAEADYLAMVTLKTGHYTVVGPLRLGALCADRDPHPLFEPAGLDLGAAFQIRDDVLNLMPDVDYGKEFAGDLYEAKRTLILAHFFAQADPEARDDVRRRLGRPRGERRPSDIDAVLERLHATGSVAYAQRVAEAKATAGLEQLRLALATLPKQAFAAELAGLLESLALRRQ